MSEMEGGRDWNAPRGETWDSEGLHEWDSGIGGAG
jgi:hypothetical protein